MQLVDYQISGRGNAKYRYDILIPNAIVTGYACHLNSRPLTVIFSSLTVPEFLYFFFFSFLELIHGQLLTLSPLISAREVANHPIRSWLPSESQSKHVTWCVCVCEEGSPVVHVTQYECECTGICTAYSKKVAI